ncbi:hypothetical protein [Dialister invisus]|uniref:hypothetical protein n=1 Tax=Dialister invisus TaxID=218538 RepID=UPI002352AB34|nr:hypothetical protein [Dialister invisus]
MGKTANGTVTRSEESMTLMTPCRGLSVSPTMGTDPSLALRMTSYCTPVCTLQGCNKKEPIGFGS